MTTFPNSPDFSKGAIVAFDPDNPLASVIIFRRPLYNPNTLTRSLQPRTSGSGGDRSEALRLEGAPEETFSAEVEIDLTDQLEEAEPGAVLAGIHPQLAALEMLLYPKTTRVIENAALLEASTLEIIPPEAPFTLLVWGPKRVLPVRLTSFTITEQAHNVNLDPIRATVSLSLRVLSYNDLPTAHRGYSLFLVHQVLKEAMATVASAGNVAAVAGGNVSLL